MKEVEVASREERIVRLVQGALAVVLVSCAVFLKTYMRNAPAIAWWVLGGLFGAFFLWAIVDDGKQRVRKSEPAYRTIEAANSSPSRIAAGFHRIGVVLAILPLASGLGGLANALFVAAPQDSAGAWVWVAVSFLLAGLAYSAARALGWIVAGFTGR